MFILTQNCANIINIQKKVCFTHYLTYAHHFNHMVSLFFTENHWLRRLWFLRIFDNETAKSRRKCMGVSCVLNFMLHIKLAFGNWYASLFSIECRRLFSKLCIVQREMRYGSVDGSVWFDSIGFFSSFIWFNCNSFKSNSILLYDSFRTEYTFVSKIERCTYIVVRHNWCHIWLKLRCTFIVHVTSASMNEWMNGFRFNQIRIFIRKISI